MIHLDSCLEQIITKLVVDLSNSNKLEAFRTAFQKRKIYNQREKTYIENQKIKQELGADYDSEESDLQQQFQQFGPLTKYEMKCLLKDNLIRNKFDQNKLSYIEPPTPDQMSSDRDYAEKHELESINRKIEAKNDLKVIAEKKTLHILGRKNFQALDFIIKELQNMAKN